MHISIWEKETFYHHNDVLIIGSGFVGLWSAWYLKKKSPKLRISIVERGIVPTGASTRNAGFACFGSLTELAADAANMGEASMLDLVDMRFRGLKRIRKLLSQKKIDYATCGGYELITGKDAESLSSLQDKIDWLNTSLRDIIGEKKIFQLADKKIKKFGFAHVDHLVENKLEGCLHSGKLCQELLHQVQSMGVNVLTATAITSFQKNDGSFSIQTNHHFSLSADQLLVCTNAFAKQLLPELDVQPARGQVLVTSPLEPLPFKGTFHFDEGFYYFRNVGNRILLGGARNKAFDEEKTYDMEISEKIQGELESYLAESILPGKAYSIEHRWSGIMGMGGEKMPIVKELQPGIFCAVRMSGMGVTLAPIVGEKVAKLMRG